MNTVCLTGRITKAPDSRTFTKDGEERDVCTIRLAVARRYGSQEADFFTIECFGKLAQTMAKYGDVSRLVGVEGRLQQDEWTQDDERQERVKVRASSIQFLDAPSTKNDVADDGDFVDSVARDEPVF